MKPSLPALFATESGQNQLAVAGGIAALFGSKTLHPALGAWTWDGVQIGSSVYGTAGRPRQPRYDQEAGDFGLFKRVERLRVSAQLEGEGLRTAVRWHWKGD